MSYIDRKEIYLKIEQLRKRPLITYVTTIRQGISVQMATDVIPEFIDQISTIDTKYDEVDLLIISGGGDPIVAWRIISLLRERFKKISVLVPFIAYSSATLLALGADDIIMHPFGNLGPIDPQIVLTDQNGKQRNISYDDILKYIEFVKDIGITNEELLQRSFDKLTNEISPTTIGIVKKGAKLGISLGEKLLSTHMSNKNDIERISKTLNTKFYNHGYPLGRKECIEIGLPIIKPKKDLEELLLKLYKNISDELKFNQPFNADDIILDQILNSKSKEIGKLNVVTKFEKLAVLESSRLDIKISNEVIANYIILNNGKINKNIIIKPGYWKKN